MILDIPFLILALYGFYLGYTKGIIQTVFTILSFVFGLLAAFKFSPAMTDFLEAVVYKHPLMFIVGFILTFVLAMVLIRTIAKALEGLLESANINVINQFAGGILMGGLMILLYSVLLWFGDRSRILDQSTKESSLTYQYIEHFPEKVWTVGKRLQPTFKEFWDYSLDMMDKIKESGVEETESDPSFYDAEETGN